MVLTPHAVVGAGVALLFPNQPLVGVAAAFCSHFILDAIPHWDYKILSSSARPLSNEKFTLTREFYLDLVRIGTDAVIGLALSLLIFSPRTLVALGACAAMFPDFLQFVYARLPNSPLKYLQSFHIWIHAKKRIESAKSGIFLQAVFVIVFLLIIFIPR